MKNVNGMLLCRMGSLCITVLNAHSQVLFPALDPQIDISWLIYTSLGCILGFTAIAAVFLFTYRDKLGKQLGPYGERGRYFYLFILISFLPDTMGLILTAFLGQKLGFDKFNWVSNLLPAILSMCNTMINAYV
jgi:hypothetical protein